MSTGTILYFAIGVFTLMVMGIVLTGLEFRKMNKLATNQKSQGLRGE